MVPELNRSEVRQVLHPPYRLIYRIEAKRILVLTVRHGREHRHLLTSRAGRMVGAKPAFVALGLRSL